VTTAATAAAGAKTHCKNVTWSKKYLLAGKEMFLLGAYKEKFSADANLVL